MSGVKRKMTLDLSFSNSQASAAGSAQTSVIKRARIGSSLQTPIFSADLLASPDFKNIPATPILDFAMKGLGMIVPENLTTVTSVATTTIQPAYVLPNYTHMNNAKPSSSVDSDEGSMTNDSMTSSTNSTYTSNAPFAQSEFQGSYGAVGVKQEQPSRIPIDMENQEMAKLERKRMRNRVAASKCRKRKLEKISKLEEKVNQLKRENGDLESVLLKLRDGVSVLKDQVRKHAQAGCQIMVSNSVDQFN